MSAARGKSGENALARLPAWLVAAVLYLLLLLPAFYPFLFQGMTLYQGDIFLYFEPTLRYMADAIKAGRLPLWNPLVCNGVSQIAIISPGLFYLPNLAFVFMPFGAALAASLMFHQWLSGFGTWLFLRERGLGAQAAIVGGAAVMLNGYMFGSSQCYTLPATFAWTPLALYFIACLARSGRLFWAGLLALAFAMQILAGRPEMFMSAALIYAVFAFSACREQDDLKLRVIGPVACLMALALGLGIAAPALFPVLELYSLSPRMAGLRFGEVSLWSAGWFDWLQVILTRPFGDLVVSSFHLSPHHPGLFPYISSLFLGAPVVTLALIGFFDTAFRGRLMWLVIAGLFAMLAAGRFAPLLPFLYSLSPSLAVLRYPIKVAVFALFAFCIAAARGWEVVAAGKLGDFAFKALALLWMLAAMAGNAVFVDAGGVTTALCRWIYPGSAPSADALAAITSAAGQLSMAAFLGLLTLAAGLQLKVGRFRKDIMVALMGFVVIQPLLMNGPAYLWHMTGEDFYRQPSELAAWLEGRRDRGEFRLLAFLPDSLLSPRRLWRPDDPLAHSIAQSQYERQILEADVNMDYGLASSYGFMPTDTRAFMMLYIGVCARSRQYAGSDRVGPVSDAPLHRFCQLTNTHYLVTTSERPDRRRHVIEPMPLLDERYFSVCRVVPEMNLRVYAVRDPLPRAYFRSAWQFTPSQVESLKEIFWADRSAFDPQSSVLIDSEQGRMKAPAYSPGESGVDAAGHGGEKRESANVDILSDTGEEVVLSVRNDRPGFLVLSDTHYPGWKAYDGREPLPIYQANGFMRAVFLDAGSHTVRFAYRPYSLFWGGVLCAICLSVAVLLVLASLYLYRRQPDGGGA